MGHRDRETTERYADYAPSPHEAALVAAAFGGAEARFTRRTTELASSRVDALATLLLMGARGKRSGLAGSSFKKRPSVPIWAVVGVFGSILVAIKRMTRTTTQREEQDRDRRQTPEDDLQVLQEQLREEALRYEDDLRDLAKT